MTVTASRPPLRARLALAILAPIVVIGAVEVFLAAIGVEAAGPARSFGNFSFGLAWTHTPEPAILRTHPSRLYEPKPHLRGVVRTDRFGFRGPDRPGDHERLLRIAIVGDSTVFGFGVAYGDSFVGRVASELRARYPTLDIDVIDAACHGYSSLQNRLDLDDRVLPLAPDVVVLCLSGFNDSVGALEMDDEAWSRIGPERDSVARRWLRKSRIANSILAADSENERATTTSAPREPTRSDAPSPLRRVSIEKFDSNVRAMIERIRQSGATALLMTHSFREDALVEDEYRARHRAALEAIASSHSVELVRGAESLENGATRFYFDKIHPTEEGHERLASTLVAALDPLCASFARTLSDHVATPAPTLRLRDDPGSNVVIQLEPKALIVDAEVHDDDTPRFFVGGTPADDFERRVNEFRLTLPPLPVGRHSLEIATRSGSTRIADAIEVRSPELEIRLDGHRARVTVRSGSLASRVHLHVALERGDKPMMLRRRFELKEGTALGSPIESPMTLESPGVATASFEAPIGAALTAIPRLYVQALVEPDPDRCARIGEFAIAWPTNVVELSR